MKSSPATAVSFAFAMLMVVAANPLTLTAWAHEHESLRTNTASKSSDASVLCLTKEGITNFESLTDFNKKSMERLPATIKEPIDAIVADPQNNIAAENAVPGATLSSISVHRLIVAMNAAEYYTLIG